MAVRVTAKWKLNYIKGVSNMSNGELLQATVNLGGGDDYDLGCFTKIGAFEFYELKCELLKRLHKAKWLPKDFELE